jgi:hypothetical protein
MLQSRTVAQVGGLRTYFRQLTDLVRYIWVFYVIGFNAERQERAIYGPLRALAVEARAGFQMMGEAVQTVVTDLLHFRNVKSLISIPGFLISFAALLLLVGLIRVGLWLWRWGLRWYRGADPESTSLLAGAVFYRRLAHLLAEYGLERPPAETQAEFARRATIFLTGRGSSTEALADVPRLVVDAFYRVRFGHLDLTPADLSHLEARLDALEASLRSTQA